MKWLLVLVLFAGEEGRPLVFTGDSKDECEEARSLAVTRPNVWASDCIEVKRPPPPPIPLEKQSDDGFSVDGKRRGNRT